MSDVAAAPETTAPVSETPAPETPTTDATPPPAATPPAPKGPSAIAKLYGEKFADLRAKKAARVQRTQEESQAKQLAEKEASLEAQLKRLQGVQKNPIEVFRELGIAPEALYQTLTDHLLEREKPENKQKQQYESLKEEILKEFKPLKDEFETAKKELEALRKEKEDLAKARKAEEQNQRIGLQLETFKEEKYAPLRALYTDQQLIGSAYEVAKALRSAGLANGFQDVADRLLDLHNDWVATRVDPWMKSQTPSTARTETPPPAAEPEKEAPPTALLTRAPTAIGNSRVTEVASSTENLSSKEKAAKRAKSFEKFLAEQV